MSAYGMNRAGLGVPNFTDPDIEDANVPFVPVHTQFIAVTTLLRLSVDGLTMNWGKVHVNCIIFSSLA